MPIKEGIEYGVNEALTNLRSKPVNTTPDLPLATRINLLKDKDPKRYQENMQRLIQAEKDGNEEARKLLGEIGEDAVRNRRGYEKLSTAMTIAPMLPVAGGMAWKAMNNPWLSAGIDVATGNYGDAAVGLATDLIPFNKIMDFAKGIREINKINGNFITIDRPLPFTSRSKIRGYIAGYNETDTQIQELYNRIPYNTELVRKWSDLADDKGLFGLDRRKFIIDNVVSAVNRTSRTVDNNTNKKLLDDYLFKVRSNRAYGDRNLGMASDEREILHFGDDLTSTRTHFEGPQGILINKPKLNGDISSVYLDDNNPFSKFDNSWKITNKSIAGKVYIDNNSRNKVIESIRRILPENSDIKIDGFIHSDIGLYKPDRRINMFENKFNTSITGFNKDIIFNKVPQNSKWWEIPGFYDLKHKK